LTIAILLSRIGIWAGGGAAGTSEDRIIENGEDRLTESGEQRITEGT